MAQFTRGQLKSLVKECLVEILAEGLSVNIASVHTKKSSNNDTEKTLISSAPIQERNRALSNKTKSIAQSLRSNSPALNSVVYGSNKQEKNHTESYDVDAERRLENVIRDNISYITDDPIMSQILSDTASTTLQEQFKADGVTNSMSNIADNSSDDFAAGPLANDFLSNSAKNWETLAFSDTPKRR